MFCVEYVWCIWKGVVLLTHGQTGSDVMLMTKLVILAGGWWNELVRIISL